MNAPKDSDGRAILLPCSPSRIASFIQSLLADIQFHILCMHELVAQIGKEYT
jgi:hypothetical protein